MIKEFEIKDILNAVKSISEIDKKKSKILEKKDDNNQDGTIILSKQVKSNKSEILVLDQMID
tara:strand:- start:695 stop:880 length:186 start_codon:yes stop_codon:yes gene_type:complete